jgi:FkbM family methyltransferase
MTEIQTAYRYHFAKILLASWPPVIAQRLRQILYPINQAKKDDIEFINKSKTGSLFKGRTSDYHAYPFSVNGYFEWRNVAIARAVCQPGDEIIEIGANIGTETIGFADTVTRKGKVHAFEPVESNLLALNELILLNKFDHLLVYPYAAGETRETIKFVQPPTDMSGMGHILGCKETPDNDLISVECYPIDDFAANINRLAAIFIDAEGVDLLVIKGAHKLIQLYRPVITFEVSLKHLKKHDISIQDITSELDQLNYLYYRIGRWDLEPVDLTSKLTHNWLAIPSEKSIKVKRINRLIVYSAIMPFIGKLNPLSC